MDADWVDASGRPIDIFSTVHPDQLNLALPGLPPLTRSAPLVRYWRTSLAAEEPYDLGSFDYGRHPEIFLGRNGLGPLRVGCDTNILIDILTHGRSVLDELDGPIAKPPTTSRSKRYSGSCGSGLAATSALCSRSARPPTTAARARAASTSTSGTARFKS